MIGVLVIVVSPYLGKPVLPHHAQHAQHNTHNTTMAVEAKRIKKELLAFHPHGNGIDILGTEEGSNGRTCENHTVASGRLLEEDMVLRLRKCQIIDEHGYETTVIAAHWVTEGNDS